MNKIVQAILLPVSLLVFMAAIYTVRYFDNARNHDTRQELSCPQGETLVLDTSRNFVCLSGSQPMAVN